MKNLSYILIGVLAAACLAGWLRPDKVVEDVKWKTRYVTVYKVDTLRYNTLVPLWLRTLPDTIRVGAEVLQREEAVYQDSTYRITISGIRPRLDELQLYPRTVTQVVTNDIYHTVSKPKRWGLGLQSGWAYPSGWYIGVGVSYNFLMW